MEFGYGRDAMCTDKVSAEYMHINNFGYYRHIDTEISVHRPCGRQDYQIIYIEKGCGRVWKDDEMQTVQSGSTVVFKPGERQLYTFSAESDAAYYWIHFTGVGAEEMLDRLGISSGIYKTGELAAFRDGIEKMFTVCRVENFTTEDFLTGCTITILAEAAKKLYIKETAMEKVIAAMQSETAQNGRISDYAKICGLSEYHFIRKFKEETGMSPHRYKTKLLTEKAADLLAKTQMSVSDIADSLGYADSLYFSRIFKKYIGVSPMNYRKVNKT